MDSGERLKHINGALMHKIKHQLTLAMAVICLDAFSLCGQETQSPDGKERLVAAVYMDGFSADRHPNGNALPSGQNNIRGRMHPDQIASSDAAAVSRWDIEQAKEAGIDAFAIWVYPRLGDASLGGKSGLFQARVRLETLFTEMQKAGGLKFYPDYWWYKMSPENWSSLAPAWNEGPMPDVETEMKRQGEMLRDWAVKFGDVWAKRNGKLIIGMQDHELFKNVPYAKASEWLFGPLGGRDKVYLALSRYPVNGTISADWLAGADAIIDWDANRSYGDSLAEHLAGKDFAMRQSKSWWPSIAPSFSQSRSADATAPKTPTVYERLGIMAFRRAWLDAIADDAPTVYLITWNDKSEDSEIMPTADHGYAMQRLTRYFSRWHHERQIPKIEREELLLFHHPQVVEGLELPAGRQPTTSPASSLTPPTDYVTLCSFLYEPADVTIRFHRQIVAEKRLPAGFHTWLLYHPGSMPPDAPKGAKAVYPEEEGGLSVTTLPEAFKDMELSVNVSRNGVDLGRFFSHTPVVSAAGRADLGTIGDVFAIKR